jgi:hypothetical protein
LIALAAIAGYTGYHEVRVMRWAALGDRDYMLNNIPLGFGIAAILATPPVSIVDLLFQAI